ncbi:unnamed protein product [Discula destructiva]
MDEHLKPPNPDEKTTGLNEESKGHEDLRLLSRSPHPYHQRAHEILEPSDNILVRASSIPSHREPHQDNIKDQLLPFPASSKDSTPATESGTEADDETYVKRLPPSRTKLHKGLRGRNEVPSGPGTPLLTPATDENLDGLAIQEQIRRREDHKRHKADQRKRNRVLGRRGAEAAILSSLAWLVVRNPAVKPVAALWENELQFLSSVAMVLLCLYPTRLTIWAFLERHHPLTSLPLSIPATFDPAPFLYPQMLTMMVALLTASNVNDVVLPNLILAIASIPRILVPSPNAIEVVNNVHWFLTCVPLVLRQWNSQKEGGGELLQGSIISPEDLSLLYPLHQTLCITLRELTKDSDPAGTDDPTKGSLLPTEIQLLSISLINLWLLSNSPQAVILKAILWVGGLGILVLCSPAVQWSINLARVPKWRFRRNETPECPAAPLTVRTVIGLIFGWVLNSIGPFLPSQAKGNFESGTEASDAASGFTTDEEKPKSLGFHRRRNSLYLDRQYEDERLKRAETVPVDKDTQSGLSEPELFTKQARRHTLHSAESMIKSSKTHTPAGRRKRSASSSTRYYFDLTPEGANRRKWLYALWVYLSIIAVVAFVDSYVMNYALDGNEPFGWAIGFLFGDNEVFRSFVTFTLRVEDWILLPGRLIAEDFCHLGWVQRFRYISCGAANTRLLIAAWWVGIVIVGLAIVFKLSKAYEVDTRRKVFHFMMVSMFLPATFIDPTWCALALSVVLAVFLLLDMLRASQLPPLSTPIKNFLQPYVDGRDYQGPVVVSHIFLLIGCAIPLWLSLASLPRAGIGHLRGWEVPTRELSMVSGVVCVGLGDAAASLVGRRWGVHKWWWGGGKSLEGSLAFAAAVLVGLLAANVWLKIGGWPITNYLGSRFEAAPYRGFDALWEGFREYKWSGVVLNTGMCASVASLTEAVLTGGNDNVVVPVVLWTCVKATGL